MTRREDKINDLMIDRKLIVNPDGIDGNNVTVDNFFQITDDNDLTCKKLKVTVPSGGVVNNMLIADINGLQDIFAINTTTGSKSVTINPGTAYNFNLNRFSSGNIYPITDNTYYLGKNDDDSPFAWKGVILKDTTDGNYYRIEVTNGALAVIDLTD